jgi:ABC-type polar amino acid transport system ATPase subunit
MTAPAVQRSAAPAASNEVAIQMIDVHKWYFQFHVLKAINLTVDRGERIVICGPSGSGKSTLIRCINRLEEHQRGQIIVDGIELTSDIRHIELIRRDVGMVFQHFNLFPHLTVLQNLVLAPMWVKKEVLDVMVELAGTGMTMLCVTHEMGFARTVANRILFMDRGEIIEQGPPKEFFANPKSERTRLFLSQILHH